MVPASFRVKAKVVLMAIASGPIPHWPQSTCSSSQWCYSNHSASLLILNHTRHIPTVGTLLWCFIWRELFPQTWALGQLPHLLQACAQISPCQWGSSQHPTKYCNLPPFCCPFFYFIVLFSKQSGLLVCLLLECKLHKGRDTCCFVHPYSPSTWTVSGTRQMCSPWLMAEMY